MNDPMKMLTEFGGNSPVYPHERSARSSVSSRSKLRSVVVLTMGLVTLHFIGVSTGPRIVTSALRRVHHGDHLDGSPNP